MNLSIIPESFTSTELVQKNRKSRQKNAKVPKYFKVVMNMQNLLKL